MLLILLLLLPLLHERKSVSSPSRASVNQHSSKESSLPLLLEETTADPKLEADRRLPLTTWMEQNRVVLKCWVDRVENIDPSSLKWFRHNSTFKSLIQHSKQHHLIRDKLVLFSHPDSIIYNYSCQIQLKNGKALLSEVVSTSSIQVQKAETKGGKVVTYPSTGICAQLKGFPKTMFVAEEGSLEKMEAELLEIMKLYITYSSKHHIASDYFLPFICFSKYELWDRRRKASTRIHHEDLLNMMGCLRDEQFPLPDHILQTVINLYHENKEDIIRQTGKHSYRYSVKSFSSVRGVDCLEGNGQNYVGAINTTYSGRACQPWMSISVAIQLFPLSLQNMEHDYCRNPGGHEEGPYCYVGPVTYELCNIPKCRTGLFNVFNGDCGCYLLWLLILLCVTVFILLFYLIYRYKCEISTYFHNLKRRYYFGFDCTKPSATLGLIKSQKLDFLNGKMEECDSIHSPSPTFSDREKPVVYVLRAYSVASTLHSVSLTKCPQENLYDDIPHLHENSVTLVPAEPGALHLFHGHLPIKQLEGYYQKFMDNSSFLLEDQFLAVQCEDSLEGIQKRYYELKQSNIVCLVGMVVSERDGRRFPRLLLYEPTQLCDISSCLGDETHDWPKTLANLVDVLKQITFGLCFMHKKRIVHGDLSLKNVLVYTDPINPAKPTIKLAEYAKFRPKYADDYLFFSEAEITDETGIPRVGLYLPIKWMSPELLKSIISTDDFVTFHVCVKSDVELQTLSKVPATFSSDIYSFGVLVWELFHSARKPHETYSINSFIATVLSDSLPRLIEQENVGPIAKLVQTCTSPQPAERLPLNAIMKQIRLISRSFDLEVEISQ